ncbi:hypothetical protein HJFPF1_13045 [Paramyrothecium foliicola]|nr:hypothetical protein HJFPF1_13045 [Paramyrothecium foliicola]
MPSSDCTDFYSSLEVMYTDENHIPYHAIRAWEGDTSDADLNKGFKGKFVWIRAYRATKPSEMMNHIWRDVLDNPIEGRDDIAKGAGGSYRYLQWSNDMRANHFISSIWVWRTKEEKHSPPEGWSGKTDDINAGRGGDYLYIIWKSREYTGSKSP